MAMLTAAVWIGYSAVMISRDVNVVCHRYNSHHLGLTVAVTTVGRTACDSIGATSNAIDKKSNKNGQQ